MSLSLGIGLGLTMQRGGPPGSWIGDYDFAGNEAVFVDDFASGRYFNDGIKTFSGLNTFARTSVGTYFDSSGIMQTAASGAERLDHNPVSNVALGIITETSVDNELPYSKPDAETPTGWTSPFDSGTFTRTLVSGFGAFTGGQSAIEIQQTVSGRSGLLRNVTLSASTDYVLSCYIDTANSVHTSGSNAVLAMGSFADLTYPDGSSKAISDADANGRIVLKFTTGADVAGSARIGTGINGAAVGDMVFTAWQLETSTDVSTYIPTEATAVTRETDALHTESGGLPYVNWDATKVSGKIVVTPTQDGLLSYLNINDGSTLNFIEVYQTAANVINMKVKVSGANQCNLVALTTTVIGTSYTISFRAGVNDFGLSVDGATEVVDTLGSMPTVTRQDFGENCLVDSVVNYDVLITDLAGLSA